MSRVDSLADKIERMKRASETELVNREIERLQSKRTREQALAKLEQERMK